MSESPIRVRCHGMDGKKRCPASCTYIHYAAGWGPPADWVTHGRSAVYCPRHAYQPTRRVPDPPTAHPGQRLSAPHQPSLFGETGE